MLWCFWQQTSVVYKHLVQVKVQWTSSARAKSRYLTSMQCTAVTHAIVSHLSWFMTAECARWEEHFLSTCLCFRVSEFPPDANHGSYVPAAMLTFIADDELWNRNRSAFGGYRTTALEEWVVWIAALHRLPPLKFLNLILTAPFPQIFFVLILGRGVTEFCYDRIPADLLFYCSAI